MSASSQFAAHIRNFWPHQPGGRKEILIELNSMHSSHIAYAYIGNVLRAMSDSRIVGFKPSASIPSFLGGLGISAWPLRYPATWKIYSALGSRVVLSPSYSSDHRREAREIMDALYRGGPSKHEIESLRVRGTLVGDLAYDSFLRKKSLPTIKPESRKFKKFLKKFILDSLFWCDYIRKDTVEAVVVSHTVYANAIPARVAVTRDIPAFQATATAIHRLNPREFFAYSEFKVFPRMFDTLDEDVREAGKKMAKERLRLRFQGVVGVDMPYSKASAYSEGSGQRLLSKSNRPKVLVATHCFFDSPHAYGMNLFPDFWEWLHFLGRLSETVSFEWYLKTHRDFIPGNIPILKHFTEAYPRFSLLPTDASHHQIIEEGIDAALTVHGTIGFEYPYLGVPVINASVNNPHIGYSFNLHPKTKSEYQDLVLDIPNLPRPGEQERSEIEEFYFMKHLLKSDDLFFDEWEQVLEKIGGYQAQFTPAIYEEFRKQWTPEKHEKILNRLSSFIESDSYFLRGEMTLRNRDIFETNV